MDSSVSSLHMCSNVSTVTCQLPMTADLYTLQAKGKKPLFVQFVLENMWAVYDAVLLNRSAYTYNHSCIHTQDSYRYTTCLLKLSYYMLS